jgi:hypothetical protein
LYRESVENLIQHLAMLRRGGNARFKPFRPLPQAAHHGSKLDSFGPGSENQQNARQGILFVAVGDPALGQVVGGKLQGHAISGQNPDAIAAEFAGQMGQYGAVLIELHAK